MATTKSTPSKAAKAAAPKAPAPKAPKRVAADCDVCGTSTIDLKGGICPACLA
jgi:ribosomal protein S14